MLCDPSDISWRHFCSGPTAAPEVNHQVHIVGLGHSTPQLWDQPAHKTREVASRFLKYNILGNLMENIKMLWAT